MSNYNSIFDLSHVEDLPEKLKRQVSVSVLLEPYMLMLFEEKETLALDEIMVALYRKFKIEARRANISARLNNLVNQEKIIKLSNQLYKRNL